MSDYTVVKRTIEWVGQEKERHARGGVCGGGGGGGERQTLQHQKGTDRNRGRREGKEGVRQQTATDHRQQKQKQNKGGQASTKRRESRSPKVGEEESLL